MAMSMPQVPLELWRRTGRRRSRQCRRQASASSTATQRLSDSTVNLCPMRLGDRLLTNTENIDALAGEVSELADRGIHAGSLEGSVGGHCEVIASDIDAAQEGQRGRQRHDSVGDEDGGISHDSLDGPRG